MLKADGMFGFVMRNVRFVFPMDIRFYFYIFVTYCAHLTTWFAIELSRFLPLSHCNNDEIDIVTVNQSKGTVVIICKMEDYITRSFILYARLR